ncbi:uncharacterized protein [Chironomus tepperi]|uniref:uncharacterized protein n=1 Tax=Chironomus tepperi TaxID=113505 RepID=UPI00391FC33A
MKNYKVYSELKKKQKKRRDKIFKRTELSFSDAYSEVKNASAQDFEEEGEINNRLDIDFIIEQEETQKSSNLRDSLVDWSIKNKINRSAVSSLLKILNKYHPELPLTYNTLLNTPKTSDIKTLDSGDYLYIGLKHNLNFILNTLNEMPDYIELDICLDGAPIYENSKNICCMWPLIGKIFNINSKPFTISLFTGQSKPNDINFLLKDFVYEFIDLSKSYTFNNIIIPLKIRSIILDAPARSSVCGIKGHGGYSSCPKCYVPGFRYENKTIFSNDSDYEKRNNEKFRARDDKEHHSHYSILEKIVDLDMVEDFPIDYLHCCLLGIMRRILDIFFGFKGFYDAKTKHRISLKIAMYENQQPSDFQRRLRGLEKMNLWKGSELRTFALFVGPVVLKSELQKEHFDLFMYFHLILVILVDKTFCFKFNDLARTLIQNFTENFITIFGQKYMTYNFHILKHLPDDVLKYGALDNFSSFPFENHIGILKRSVKSPAKPLQQIYKRLMERMNEVPEKICNKRKQKLDKQIDNTTFLRLNIDDITLGYNEKDSFVQDIDGRIVKIEKFVIEGETVYLHGVEYVEKANIYELPFESSDVHEFKIKNQNFVPCKINLNVLYRKFYRFSINEDFSLLFPMTPISKL